MLLDAQFVFRGGSDRTGVTGSSFLGTVRPLGLAGDSFLGTGRPFWLAGNSFWGRFDPV